MCPPLTLRSIGMAIVPGICERCGAIFGSEVLTGATGRDIRLGGAKVGPCPSCGGIGRVPDGTYDLIDDTLRVVESAGIDKANLDDLIKLLEDRAAGRMTDREVIDQVETSAPGLAPTVKGYLAKSDPASWLALLISILMMIQSASASPPSAEEIADAIWSKAPSGAPAGPIPGESRANQTPHSPKTRGDAGRTGSGRGQRQR